MPALLLFGIPIVVGVLLFGILTLPDDSPKDDPFSGKPSEKKSTPKKKK